MDDLTNLTIASRKRGGEAKFAEVANVVHISLQSFLKAQTNLSGSVKLFHSGPLFKQN